MRWASDKKWSRPAVGGEYITYCGTEAEAAAIYDGLSFLYRPDESAIPVHSQLIVISPHPPTMAATHRVGCNCRIAEVNFPSLAQQNAARVPRRFVVDVLGALLVRTGAMQSLCVIVASM